MYRNILLGGTDFCPLFLIVGTTSLPPSSRKVVGSIYSAIPSNRRSHVSRARRMLTEARGAAVRVSSGAEVLSPGTEADEWPTPCSRPRGAQG